MMLFPVGVRVFTQEALYPLDNFRNWIERNVLLRAGAIFKRAGYASRIRQLESHVAALRLETMEIPRLEEENERLRKLLDFPIPERRRWLPAPILERGGASEVWQSIHVGRGSIHGVEVGTPAAAPDGVVGRVIEVSPHTCEIMLITDPNSRIPVELAIAGGTNSVGTIRGILSGKGVKSGAEDSTLDLLYVVEPLRLQYLERDFAPPPRTRVETSGLGRAFPKGLTIGWMLESSLDENGLSRKADVMPAVDFAGLSEVFLLCPVKGGANE